MLETVIDQHRKSLGGFEVGRVLPHAGHRMVGPFVFFDHMGPVTFPPGIPREVDVRPHPHIGLSTVTYLFNGEIMHRDSLGSEQAIRPGEVNWMTAGRGITHSERFEAARGHGGLTHGIQAWVALPVEHEEADPGFWHHNAASLPVAEEGGVHMRLLVGTAFGMTSPVKTHSPTFYAHWEMKKGGKATVPCYPERAAYIAGGSVEVDGHEYRAGQMLVFKKESPAIVTSPGDAIVMVLGGESVGPRHIFWNFVSSSKERIDQAKADWRAGRMKLPDLDNGEFIPLPPDPPPPSPNPMS